MLAVEISFPRGGKSKKKKQQSNYEDLDLFSDRQKKKPRKKKPHKQDELSAGEEQHLVIESLTIKSVSPGMVLLGCIFEIGDYCLKMSLPGRLFGTVPIVNISDKYTRLLKEFAEDPVDEVPTLHALFHVGQTLACKVMSTKAAGSAKYHITLSINPRHVNEALLPASLLHGMLLYCTVQSVEDHGYVMDIGIKDVPGFLSHASAANYIRDYNEGQSLTVGYLMPTVINMPSLKKGKLRVGQAVTVTTEIANSKLSESSVSLETFVPGTVIEAVVQKITEHGLAVDCQGFSGCVYKDHLKSLTAKHSVYKEGQSIQATVLYVNPITHVLHLTMHPKPTPKKLNKMFGGIKKWQVIDEAVVTAVHKTHICLKLKDSVQGIAVKTELSDKPIEEIGKKFSVHDGVQCRVIALHYLDNVVAVSLKESILGQTYVNRDDLTVGEMYEGTVKKLVPGGMVVVLSPGVQGFVRDIHMADTPLTKPEVMFPKGKKVKCKVLTIDRSSSPPSISLTCKKGMMMTKVPILSSYEEASRGMMTKGVIVNIRDNGLVLSFLNNIQGWVPSSEFGAYKILNPEKVFFRGQVVKCRVLNCYPEDKKLFLTLKIDAAKLFGDKDMSQNKFEVGKIVEARVKNKTEKGLDVVIKGTKFEAFLPVLHLSDHIENCRSLLECYREKDAIEVLCFSSKGVPVVTRKLSLLEAAKNGVPHSHLSEYEEQAIIPVVVKHFAKYGMFVELGYNITGLVPNKYLGVGKVLQPEDAGFIPHQTLMAKILKIELERNRVELSTKMEDVYNNEYRYGLDLLQSYFDDTGKIRQFCLSGDSAKSKLAQLSIGSVVSAKITCITEFGVLCVLSDELKGFVTAYHCGTKKVDEGQELSAVVLFVDMVNECVELSCLPNLLRNVSNLQDVDSSKVKIDQIIKSECVLIKKEFVVVALGGHAVGRFAFLPTRRALNDLTGRGELFTVGQHYHVVIKRIIFDDVALGILKQHDKDLKNDACKRKNEEENVQVKKQKTSLEVNGNSSMANEESSETHPQNNDDNSGVSEISELVVGKKYVATIKKIKEFQMDILIKNRIPGRVHITEAAKDLPEGTKPFDSFVPGSEVKVWVIGVHTKKSHNFLALSHSKMKTYVECSLFKHPPVPLKCTFKSGDEVKGFIKEVTNTNITVWLAPDIKGIIPFHHMNVDINTLLKPCKHYHSGDVLQAQVFSVSGEGDQIQLTQYRDWQPEPGKNVHGLVYVISSDRGLLVKLPHGYTGAVHLTDLRDSYTPADRMLLPLLHKRMVQCNILEVDHSKKFCQLSTRVSKLRASQSKPKDPELSEEDVKPGVIVRGFVTSVTSSAITVVLGTNLQGTVSISGMELNERSDILQTYLIGSVATVKVLSSENGETMLSIMDIQADKSSVADNDSSEGAKNKKDIKILSSGSGETAPIVDTQVDKTCVDSSGGAKKKRKRQTKKDVDEETKCAESQDVTPKSLPFLQITDAFNFNVQHISDIKIPEHTSADTSESEEEGRPKKRRKDSGKLDDEKYVFETEKLLMDENRTAQTAEEYEEALKLLPNSAGHWLNYIGFYLEQMEVDKARSVAERALKTISFREEQEKLKVWIVFLNLENMYGTQASMESVFERAVQLNEPLKIYSAAVHIYLNSNKIEEAENLYQVMVKKFHVNKDVWIDFGLFYMKAGRPELARKVMDRSLQSLDQKHHVDVIAKFAQMEFKHGDTNLGKTMFENVLKNYPKRTDLWSIYIDLLIKLGQLDAVRKLFEQVITMKMSARKMKFFFKRYLAFEKDHGTEETANEVVKKASHYFKSDFLSSQ